KQKIDDYCRQWATATGEPFVIVVARQGVIVTHEAFGTDALGQPIDRDYRSWVASITKTVTATMFSQFVDQGLIELDAPLSTVFHDYPHGSPHVPTFRQLLNHTSGLAGHGEYGGMWNPHLENIVLNAIDVNEPGKVHQYCGLGFELAAKAMEIVSGQSAARIFDSHLFQPLGFGDVVLGNASSDGEFTAMELAILGQYMINRGSYGEWQFISPATFAEFMPQPQHVAGATDLQGLGVHPIRHRKAGAPADSRRPEDLCFGPNTIGHGSFSGSIFVVDPDQQLIITQSRRAYRDADNEWFYRFFQVVAEAIKPENK
ncbi:MAG TPA: serine hydrolase domain-containing protein, partial [Pirellulaceae bacterium]|nr:serine hydrolase domain-containing protein [Pirellulaceae bacterium]